MNKSITYSCPSNIALVKYWGKKPGGIQLPANASISWSLSDLRATTTIEIQPKKAKESDLRFFLDGKSKASFEPKIKDFLSRISSELPFLNEVDLIISSQNNFPHGAGIASSAAGFGAMSMALVDAEGILVPNSSKFLEKASWCARLGSGSASRSIYGAPAIWGETAAYESASDLYAVPFTESIHEDLNNWSDAVMIVDAGEKSVSSSQGHALLDEHAYANSRFKQAQSNLEELLNVLKNGDVDRFIALVESEALQLHSMMMSSIPYYMLMRPHTISIIQEIWAFRMESKLPICFTLDAGANVHVLYDSRYQKEIQNFINNRLLSYCQNGLYLCSATGGKPEKIEND